jgi:hypothetical protein
MHNAAPKFSFLAVALICSAGAALAQPDESDVFREQDSRKITTHACTRDAKPVEGVFYLVTSFSDAQRLNKTILDSELQQALGTLWHKVLDRLTERDVFEPARTKFTHDIISKQVDTLEKTVENETGISLSIYQVESRPMDPKTEPAAPSCSFDL